MTSPHQNRERPAPGRLYRCFDRAGVESTRRAKKFQRSGLKLRLITDLRRPNPDETGVIMTKIRDMWGRVAGGHGGVGGRRVRLAGN
jgi:hypothetical protein